MAADVGQASACAGLQSRWRDSYERCGRRAKAPQAEACPTWNGDPTLARKCEVIPAPALRFELDFKWTLSDVEIHAATLQWESGSADR